MTSDARYEEIAADLDRLAAVPDDVVLEIVIRAAECVWLYGPDAEPVARGGLSVPSAVGCPVWRACLELELRTPEPYSGGVCSGLSDEEFQALHRVWFTRRERMGGKRGPLS
ncbi:WhiB family redox-sensing transcriptional regulator [Saccharothrix tamanrassetensis]|uniref:WhiB family redox-sensing transcriptional regulator n=1 Tax=Saccharothrix tamanrassetensis TaxID=1051531 RepID=A0A841CF04_9PSEU|nr:WhiB family transcriptional regulator [Saccharothrix tamanrassetensis]MBB5955881.1 WhiB family redox-sensing transcriptional regulator [Saccharothrix tamanrassetensis]